MIPQLIYLSLIFIGLLLNAHMHNKPRKGEYSFWMSFLNAVINLSLLYFGGFFDVFFK